MQFLEWKMDSHVEALGTRLSYRFTQWLLGQSLKAGRVTIKPEAMCFTTVQRNEITSQILIDIHLLNITFSLRLIKLIWSYEEYRNKIYFRAKALYLIKILCKAKALYLIKILCKAKALYLIKILCIPYFIIKIGIFSEHGLIGI